MAVDTHQIPLDVLQNEQKAASTAEQAKWLKHGAVLTNDLMMCYGKPVLPKFLHKMAALVTHGCTHLSTGGLTSIVKFHFYTVNTLKPQQNNLSERA